MRKIRVAAMAVAVAGLFAVFFATFFASRVGAFDMGDAVKGAAKAGGKAVVESEINKDLKAQNCAFKPKTAKLTCNLSDILNTLKTKKTVAEESGFADSVSVYANIGQGNDSKNPNLGDLRTGLVQSELERKVSWWDWNDQRVPGDRLEIYVKIR